MMEEALSVKAKTKTLDEYSRLMQALSSCYICHVIETSAYYAFKCHFKHADTYSELSQYYLVEKRF